MAGDKIGHADTAAGDGFSRSRDAGYDGGAAGPPVSLSSARSDGRLGQGPAIDKYCAADRLRRRAIFRDAASFAAHQAAFTMMPQRWAAPAQKLVPAATSLRLRVPSMQP